MDVIGIDEHTALMLDFAAATALVFGRGGVSWLQSSTVTRLEPGASAPLASLGLGRLPEGIPANVWDAARRADSVAEAAPAPPPVLAELVAARQAARRQGDWALADNLRPQIAAAGWQVQDTKAGPLLLPA